MPSYLKQGTGQDVLGQLSMHRTCALAPYQHRHSGKFYFSRLSSRKKKREMAWLQLCRAPHGASSWRWKCVFTGTVSTQILPTTSHPIHLTPCSSASRAAPWRTQAPLRKPSCPHSSHLGCRAGPGATGAPGRNRCSSLTLPKHDPTNLVA